MSTTNDPTTDKLQAGLETLASIDPNAFAGMKAGLDALAPGLAETIVESGFGDIARRPGLDLRQRELVSVTALAAMGGLQPQLTAHLVYALRLGWTPEELREALIQIAPLAGFPRAINGLAALAEARGVVGEQA